jgi:hypothetical protein
MSEHFTSSSSRRKGRIAVLGLAFAVAMIMGPGPGIYLVNPAPNDPQAVFTWAGIPVLYLWALFWFGIQATVVLVAYFTLWRTATTPVEDAQADSSS